MTQDLERELRKTRAILRLAYIEQRWGKIDLDTVPDDPDAKRRREVFLLDLWKAGLLPERFREETRQIDERYSQDMWYDPF
jgi:hypothetical protein